MSPRTTDDARDRAEARDRGLRRVRTATGWITVASAAGAVVLAGGYAQALPGKTAPTASTPTRTATTPAHAGTSTARPTTAASSAKPSTAVSTAAPAPKSSSAAPAAATSSAPALQPPAQAPTTAPSTTQTQATSGGS